MAVQEKLLQSKILLLDGGLGTTLEDEHGIKFSQTTPLWSSHLLLSDPHTLQSVQCDFVNAGADIVLTPTYQASHEGFRKTNEKISDDQIANYMQLAVSITRKATVSSGLVALSLGAYGAVMQPSEEYSGKYGDMKKEDLVDFHRQRLGMFNLTTVDIIAFETLPRLDEIQAVKMAVDDATPYWISCVFPSDDLLPDGSKIEDVLAAMMNSTRPWAVGLNCTKVYKVSRLVQEFEAAARKLDVKLPRLVIYPDGTNGQIYDKSRQIWVGEDEEDGSWDEKLYKIVKEVQERNQWEGIVVGGCCKTAPAHIARLRRRIDGLIS